MNIKLKTILSILLIIASSYTAASQNSFPIKPGEIGPIAPGELQYPFLCQTIAAGLGNPVIDNQSEQGTPVTDSSGKIIGYSKYCGSPMVIDYVYKPKNKDTYLPLPKDQTGHYHYPSDVDKTAAGNKYIVRIERGTLNRFIYLIAVLQDPISGKTPQQSGYKNRAIFDFLGGTGTGYTQASHSAARVIIDPHRLVEDMDPINMGFAVLFTSGNATATHYNLKLALATAQMVKEQLIAEFGKLQYTLAYGGSGGAVQQYVFAQLDPHLIDGILALASYPDFITQTPYASDCPLLEYYFDNLAFDKPTPWAKRQFIEGLAASATMPASALGQLNPTTEKIRSKDGKLGSDTCINGWGGAAPQVLNPHYPTVAGIDVIKTKVPIDWSEWGSESNQWQFGTYPTIQGITPNTIDNVGVQYGLNALKEGTIDKDTFFDLNKKIGGWKREEQFEPEDGFPMSGPNNTYDGWSSKNATAAIAYAEGKIASRKEAATDTIEAAEKSGTVMNGNLNVPILDVKVDADEEGNMHSLIHSFVTRARLQHYDKSGNQVIWIATKSPLFNAVNADVEHSFLQQAQHAMNKMAQAYFQQQVGNPYLKKPGDLSLYIMQNWVENIQKHPGKTIADNKPFYLMDGCYYQDSRGIPKTWFSKDAWNGMINPNEEKGVCTKQFKIHPTPRMVAGESILGQTLKCKLQPVDEFIQAGGYGPITMSDADIKQLKAIFPQGVCTQGK